MSQPPNESWDPNAGNPGYSYPPQQPQQPQYGAPPPQQPQPPQYGAPPPQYGAPQQPQYGAPPPQYGAPQQPGYPPQGGYPPPTPAAPPPGYPSSEDKTYALVAHFGGAVGTLISGGALSWVGGLIAYVARGNQSPTVKEHAKAALNFFIPLAGVAVLLFIGHLCGGFILPSGLDLLVGLLLDLLQFAVWVIGVVFGIVAGVKANEGRLYKYPISFPIIK